MASGYSPPSKTKPSASIALAILSAALIALLLVLGPNLQRIELAPAQRDLGLPPIVGGATIDTGTGSAGAGAFRILIQVLMIGALVALGGIVIGAIFSRHLRAYVITFAVLCGLLIGSYYLMPPTRLPAAEPQTPLATEAPTLESMTDGPGAGETEVPPPPAWSFAAVAAAISLGVAVVAAFVWARIASRRRRRADAGRPGELEELLGTVAAAADEIQLGGDPRSAVLRCYREMIRVLCRHKTIDHACMTPRELARALHRVGFTTDHIARLTEIFELVRYGNRGGQPLADRAIGCLEAIRKAYAT